MARESLSAERVINLLGLEPLPEEGGYWVQTVRNSLSTAIYYLLTPEGFSAMHRLQASELYHYYAGDPVRLLLLHQDGGVTEPVIGPDIEDGQRPQVLVSKGVWQGSSTLGDWSLLGTTMAPPYSDEIFDLGDREKLLKVWPGAKKRIVALTRD